MAHNVETMFYNREKPWHGLGVKVDKALTSAEALVAAGLDWQVNPLAVYDHLGREVDGYQLNTRSTDGAVLGVVSDKYKIVQNREAFDFTDALIGEGITYETAGSLQGGKLIWLLARMPERYILGDKFEPYLCFTNNHNGTGAVRACMTPIRVVCNNTLNAALSGAQRSWSTPHRGNINLRLEEARQTLELADAYMTRLDEEADRLANEKLDDGQIIEIVSALFPLPEKPTERQKRSAETQRDGVIACMLAPDLIQFANTKWGLLNAVTDFAGHNEPLRHTKTFAENRWASIIGGHPLLDKAFKLVG